jgi:DNA-binding response OmpR family regulator
VSNAALAPAVDAGADRPRLLIVDDVADNRQILCRRFGLRGFDTVEAESGLRALQLLTQQRFDTVLLDVMMPDMDGLTVLTRIRAQYAPAALPVIMVTALSEGGDVVRALTLGANDYLSKPVDFAVAYARVCSQVALKRAEDALRASVADLQTAKATIETAIHVHFQQVERETAALAQGNLTTEQHARVEALRTSGAEVVAAVCGALSPGAPGG